MKLQFNPDLDFQLEAIQAITDVFQGQEACRTQFSVPLLENQLSLSGTAMVARDGRKGRKGQADAAGKRPKSPKQLPSVTVQPRRVGRVTCLWRTENVWQTESE